MAEKNEDFLSSQKTDKDMVDWFQSIEQRALADVQKKQSPKEADKGEKSK